MSLIMAFCMRMDWMLGDHGCELPPQHLGECACECNLCGGQSYRLAS